MFIVPFAFNFIEWIRDNILEPFIEIISGIIVDMLIMQLKMTISSYINQFLMRLYRLLVMALKLVDATQSIFGALSGTEKVSYVLEGSKGSDYLTSIILQIPLVKNVFWTVWIISIVLCAIFIIASVIRSISNLDDTGQSVGDILRQSAGTMVMFMVIQIVTYFTVCVGNIVINGTQTAINYASDTDSDVRLSNAIFAASSINAYRTGNVLQDAGVMDMFSSSTLLKKTGAIKEENIDEKYKPNWDKVKDFYTGRAKYYDIIDVEQRLVLNKIDYLSAFICTLCVLKYMLGAAISFVYRIIAVVVSYLMAPFFVALSPIDGGSRFEKWKSYFVGACFGALGTVLAVNIYLMILPIFLKDNVIYDGSNGLMVYLIRLYSVVIISIGFEKLGDVVNQIISDSGIMSPVEGFNLVQEVVDKIKSAGDIQGGSGGKGKGKGKGK